MQSLSLNRRDNTVITRLLFLIRVFQSPQTQLVCQSDTKDCEGTFAGQSGLLKVQDCSVTTQLRQYGGGWNLQCANGVAQGIRVQFFALFERSTWKKKVKYL